MPVRVAVSLIFAFYLSSPEYALCQPSPDIDSWEPDIRKFEHLDSVETYPPSSVLFAGSSSIRLWSTLAEDMAPYPVIQRGYGGAKLDDLLYYSERIIYPHRLSAIVLFVGNDIIGSEEDKTPDEVQYLAGEVFSVIRHKFPGVPVFYIATTPTPVRWVAWPLIKEANEKIRQLCRNRADFYFIETDFAYLGNDSLPVDSLFLGDRLHMNAEGYRIWKGIIKDELDSVLTLPAQNNPSTDR